MRRNSMGPSDLDTALYSLTAQAPAPSAYVSMSRYCVLPAPYYYGRTGQEQGLSYNSYLSYYIIARPISLLPSF